MYLQDNLQFLFDIAPDLSAELASVASGLTVSDTIVQNNRPIGSDIIDNIEAKHFYAQLDCPRKIYIQRPAQSGFQLAKDVSYDDLLDEHEPLILMSASKYMYRDYSYEALPVRDYILISSKSLIHVNSLSTDVLKSIRSLTIIESDPVSMAEVFSVISLKPLIEKLKSCEVGLDILYDHESKILEEKLFVHLSYNQPLSFGGLGVVTPRRVPPALIDVVDFCFSQSKMAERFIAQLGSSTDNLNHLRQALTNLSLHSGYAQFLRPGCGKSIGLPAVITGSGPSLDLQLADLAKCDDSCYLIAAGSSIKCLLEQGIIPNALVLLERAAELYDELYALAMAYPLLRSVQLISSLSVDHRIPLLFDHVYFFVRPAMPYSALGTLSNYALSISGPEAVNAAVDAAVYMGFCEIHLIGCDFGSVNPDQDRASSALSHSLRKLNKPVLGNKRKTIYTQSSLEYARESLEYLLNYYAPDNIKVCRYGEGLPINSVKVAELPDQTYGRAGSQISIPNDSRPTLVGDEIDHTLVTSKLFTDLRAALSDYVKQIRLSFSELVLDPSSVSYHRKIRDILTTPEGVVDSDESVCPSRLIKTMLRELIFYVYLCYQDQFDTLPITDSLTQKRDAALRQHVLPTLEHLEASFNTYILQLMKELGSHGLNSLSSGHGMADRP